MAGKKAAGENTKKAAGNAKKAEAAAQKQAVKDRDKAAVEESEWSKGAKSTAKADAAAAKASEAARKKAEKAALLREEEASLPSKPKSGSSKSTPRKSRALDLSGLDDPSSASASALNASGIDDALDALALTSTDTANARVERHPERRFKAAYTVYEERRLAEMAEEKGLRRQQKVEVIRKEFEKHPDNPFNQVSASYNATGEEVKDIKEQERKATERRLAG